MSKGSMQRLSLLGHLGADPEIKNAKDVVIAKLSVATNERIKKRDSDEWQDDTVWHRVTFFNKNAEFCRDYLKKGNAVYIEAKLRNSKWEDKDGKEQYGIDIIGQAIQSVGRGKNQEGGATEGSENKPLDDIE
jgi:single-strand DNA-binding protein